MARDLFNRAKKNKFAVGAFNIDDQATLIAVCRAAKKLNAPVIVEFSQTEVDFLGLDRIRLLVDSYKKEMAIEIYINLDHSPSIDTAKKAIDLGYEFIHIDLSAANKEATYQQIVDGTKEVVRYAKKTGALVESEPHYFQGSSSKHSEPIDYTELKKTFSDPIKSKEFVELTGIDTFAAAIGNLHGSYPVPKQLDLRLLTRLKKELNCFISLHGGSGTPLDQFQQAAAIGVTKINVNTDLRIAYKEALQTAMLKNPTEVALIKLMPEVIDAVQNIVEQKIISFNSADRAKV